MLDGDPPFFPKFLPVKSVKSLPSAVKELRRQKRLGYDFIKIYSRVSESQFLAVTDEARTQGLYCAGHAPDTVPFETVLKGMRSVEHLTGFINPYYPGRSRALGSGG